MFHDLILDKKLAVDLIRGAQDQKWRDFFVTAAVLGSDALPHTFYFDRDHIDQQIIDTGHEFYREGFLDFPFDDQIFVFDNAIENSVEFLSKNKREAYLIRRISKINNPFFNVAFNKNGWLDGFSAEYIVQKFTEYDLPARGITPMSDPIFAFLGTKEIHQQYGAIATIPFQGWESEVEQNKFVLDGNYSSSIGTLIGAMMLLNTKYADKRENRIDLKLNQRRLKNGRTPLQDYTTVHLGAEFGHREGTGTHARPRPHWRRGHIRRLADRVTKVMPCLVNFDGQEIPEKIYKVAR